MLADAMKPGRFAQAMRLWWLGILEQHYQMCAEVEEQKAREHLNNAGYYQKKAMLARTGQRRA